MGSSKDKQTIGYHYSVGMHMIPCLGPIDGIKQIWVGENAIWPDVADVTSQAVDGQTSASVDEPNMFGGEERGGGVVGEIDIQYGYQSQAKNSYLISQLSPVNEYIPAYRGLVSVILKQVNIGTSPQIKPWAFLAKRTDILIDESPQWYSAKADIDGDLNPVHIIREVLTSNLVGLGYSTGLINDANFMAVADTLYSEDFGLSFEWNAGDTPAEDFIIDVLRHIDGRLYQNPTTGLFNIVLIRDDYDPALLDVYDEDSIIDITSFKRELLGSVPNKFVLKYSNEAEDVEGIAGYDDIAMIDLEGKIIPSKLEYMGITKGTLASKIAARDGRQITSMPVGLTVIGKRNMVGLTPGSVFKINWGAYGLVGLIMRVVQVDYGSLTEGRLKFECIEDIFYTTAAMYAAPALSGWVNPINEPSACPARLIIEVPYWGLARGLGASAMAVLDDDAGYIGVSAMKPTSDAYNYELLVRDGLTLDFSTEPPNQSFTPTATLNALLPKNAANATIALNGVVDLDSVVVDSYGVIESECIKVLSVNIALNQITIARGVLDTVPASHAAASRVWFSESVSKFVDREYAATEQPGIKILPITGKGKFAEGSAAAFNADVLDSRMFRPYLPGDFKVNSNSYPVSFSGQPTVSWKHRDREQQTAYIIEHSEGNIGPEAGTTYTLRIYDENNVLVRTETGLVGTTYTYDELDERSDCGIGSGAPLNTQLRFVLWSVRDGYDSWQTYDLIVLRV